MKEFLDQIRQNFHLFSQLTGGSFDRHAFQDVKNQQVNIKSALLVPLCDSFQSLPFPTVFLEHHVIPDYCPGFCNTVPGVEVFISKHHIFHSRGDKSVALDHSSRILSRRVLTFASQTNETNRNAFALIFIDSPLYPLDHHTNGKPLDFIKLLQNVPNGTGILNRISERITLFNDLAVTMESCDIILLDIQVLINDCYNLVGLLNETDVESELHRASISWDAFYQDIESFAVESTYEIVFFRITTQFRDEDRELLTLIQDCQAICPFQLGVPPEYGPVISTAGIELSAILGMRTPLEKIKCLAKCFHAIHDHHTNVGQTRAAMPLSSDLLVAIFCLILIKENPFNLCSNLYYMTRFIFETKIDQGEYGFILTTFEASVQYLKSNATHFRQLAHLSRGIVQSLESGNLDMLEYALSKFTAESRISSPDSPNSPSTLFLKENLLPIDSMTGDSLLHIAARNGHIGIIRSLLSRDADLNAQNYSGDTVLHVCTRQGTIDVLKLFLNFGADPLIRNADDDTPFMVAIDINNLEVAAVLFDIKQVDLLSWTKGNALQHASSAEAIDFLLENSHQLSSISILGHSTFLQLVATGKNESASHLVQYCRRNQCSLNDISKPHMDGRTWLHTLSQLGTLDLLREAFSNPLNSAVINAEAKDGNTPLHDACASNHYDVVRLLVQNKANCFAQNTRNQIPKDLTANRQIQDFLEDVSIFSQDDQEDFRPGTVISMIVASQSYDAQDTDFTLKTGTWPDVELISTVQRKLSEFWFLYKELCKQSPDCILPDLDLVFPEYKKSKRLKPLRVIQILNTFLRYLLRHPRLHNNDIIWEFLTMSHLEQNIISQITEAKVEFRETTCRKYRSFVKDVNLLKARYDERLSQNELYHEALEKLASSARRLSKLKQSSSAQLHSFSLQIVQSSLLRPEYFYEPSVAVNLCMDSYKACARLIVNVTHASHEVIMLLSGLKKTVVLVQSALDSFSSRKQDLDNASAGLQKMEFIAQTTADESHVEKLKEAYNSFVSLSEAQEIQGCTLNFLVDQFYQEEEFVKKYMNQKVNRILDDYAKKMFALEKNVCGILSLPDLF